MQDQQRQIRHQIKILNGKISDFFCIQKIEKELELPFTNFKLFANLINLNKIFVLSIEPVNKIIAFVQFQGDNEEAEIITLGVKKNFKIKGMVKN